MQFWSSRTVIFNDGLFIIKTLLLILAHIQNVDLKIVMHHLSLRVHCKTEVSDIDVKYSPTEIEQLP